MQIQQRGFTLIELIMVIVVLGTLAAFALPKFANLGRDARIAAVEGAAASLKSASAIAHATWLSGGSVAGYLSLEGKTVVLVNGYPQAYVSLSGLTDVTGAAGIDADNFAITGASNAVTVRPFGVASTVSCYVSYTQASVSGSVVTPPSFSVQTGGC